MAEAALSAARARSSDMVGAIQIVGHADFLAEVVAPLLVPLLEAGIRVRLQTGDHNLVMRQLIEGHCDLGISAFPLEDRRLRSEAIRDEPVLAVAAPAIAARLNAAADLGAALAAEPVLAYNMERPVVDGWLATNGLSRGHVSPALSGQDMRALRHLLTEGFGWSVLPDYLCRSQIERGQLAEIRAPMVPPPTPTICSGRPARCAIRASPMRGKHCCGACVRIREPDDRRAKPLRRHRRRAHHFGAGRPFLHQHGTVARGAEIRAMHAPDLTGVAHGLKAYLSEWLGGPALFSPVKGHPRMKMRHMPFPIASAQRDAWLACMKEALDTTVENRKARLQIYASMEKLADWMRNKPD
jgi:truncated hemoglobin YjbI/DNA-binding transcriptional LysR family regulator